MYRPQRKNETLAQYHAYKDYTLCYSELRECVAEQYVDGIMVWSSSNKKATQSLIERRKPQKAWFKTKTRYNLKMAREKRFSEVKHPLTMEDIPF